MHSLTLPLQGGGNYKELLRQNRDVRILNGGDAQVCPVTIQESIFRFQQINPAREVGLLICLIVRQSFFWYF